MRTVLAKVDADFIQNRCKERISFTGPHTSRGHIDPVPVEMLHDGGRHGRANNILRTGKENGIWQVARHQQNLSAPVQDTDQREEPPCRVKIDVNLAGKPFFQNFAALIVQAAPRHIDGFNL